MFYILIKFFDWREQKWKKKLSNILFQFVDHNEALRESMTWFSGISMIIKKIQQTNIHNFFCSIKNKFSEKANVIRHKYQNLFFGIYLLISQLEIIGGLSILMLGFRWGFMELSVVMVGWYSSTLLYEKLMKNSLKLAWFFSQIFLFQYGMIIYNNFMNYFETGFLPEEARLLPIAWGTQL